VKRSRRAICGMASLGGTRVDDDLDHLGCSASSCLCHARAGRRNCPGRAFLGSDQCREETFGGQDALGPGGAVGEDDSGCGPAGPPASVTRPAAQPRTLCSLRSRAWNVWLKVDATMRACRAACCIRRGAGPAGDVPERFPVTLRGLVVPRPTVVRSAFRDFECRLSYGPPPGTRMMCVAPMRLMLKAGVGDFVSGRGYQRREPCRVEASLTTEGVHAGRGPRWPSRARL